MLNLFQVLLCSFSEKVVIRAALPQGGWGCKNGKKHLAFSKIFIIYSLIMYSMMFEIDVRWTGRPQGTKQAIAMI